MIFLTFSIATILYKKIIFTKYNLFTLVSNSKSETHIKYMPQGTHEHGPRYTPTPFDQMNYIVFLQKFLLF